MTDSPVPKPTDELQTLELWHARLSHVGFSQLERLAKMAESPITGMKITNFTKCMCEACIMSKLKDISHPSKVRHKATAPHARDGITPFQHLYRQKADVKHARVWGCPCYSHVIVSKQVKTPDKAKALEGIFLGRHEVDGLSSDGDMILTREGEVISSAVTVFCEDWKLRKSPAANSVAELNQPQKVPNGKSVILSTFDGISCIIMALKKAGD